MATHLSKTRVKGTSNLVARSWTTTQGERRTRYYVRFRDWKGVDRELPAGDVLKSAKEFRDETMTRNLHRYNFDQSATKDVAFTDWCTHWLALQRTKKSHGRYELACRPLLLHFGQQRLSTFTASQIEQYKTSRQAGTTAFGTPPTPATINRELQALRSLLILAERDGLIARRPHLAMLEESNQRDRTATADEYQQIYEAMPLHLRPILTLCKELGLRTNEAVLLRADQIDWGTRILTLTSQDTKTRRKRTLPMNDIVEHSLHGLQPGKAGRLFFHNGKPLTRYVVWWHFKKAATALGIQGLTVHDLRGTFATDKLAEGHEAELVRRLTGHTSAKAFERYVRPREDQLRKIVDRPTRQTVH